MVRLIGRAEARELLCMCEPVKIAAIDHATSHLSGHTVHILGGGVGDNVSAPFERAAVDRCGERIVDDKRHTVFVGYLGKFLDVENSAARVGDGFTEKGFGVRLEGSLYLFLAGLRRNEGALDAEFLQRDAEEIECAAVNLIRGNEMVASLTDIE